MNLTYCESHIPWISLTMSLTYHEFHISWISHAMSRLTTMSLTYRESHIPCVSHTLSLTYHESHMSYIPWVLHTMSLSYSFSGFNDVKGFVLQGLPVRSRIHHFGLILRHPANPALRWFNSSLNFSSQQATFGHEKSKQTMSREKKNCNRAELRYKILHTNQV